VYDKDLRPPINDQSAQNVRYRTQKGNCTEMVDPMMDKAKLDKQDRRSRRTRSLLMAALVDLMLEKPFDAISVQDILDKADVGRSTFYGHFTDKNDLLLASFGEMVHGLATDMHGNAHAARQLLPSLALLHHVRDQHRLYKALVWGRGFDFIAKHVTAQMSRYVEHNLSVVLEAGVEPKVPLPVVANFVVSTLWNLLQWWVEGNPTYSPEQVESMFRQLIEPTIQNTLSLKD
jgi:AcrR family transcriptional regulator